MRPGPNKYWNNDDFELEAEFEDIASVYRDEAQDAVRDTPRVPSALDRKIREQARFHAGEELSQHWIFGRAPQLALAASLLFGIGVFFIVTPERVGPDGGPKVAHREPVPPPVLVSDAADLSAEAEAGQRMQEAAEREVSDARRSAGARQIEEIVVTASKVREIASAPSPVEAFTASEAMISNQEEGKKMSTDVLDGLAGTWHGENSMWLSPEHDAEVSASTATISSVASGKFVNIAYTWEFKGKQQEGVILVGADASRDAIEAAWVDSFHMGDSIMSCQGEVEQGVLSMSGSYRAPPGPDWGWRIVITPLGSDEFQLRMFNITPEGEEALAVEANYSRG